MATTSSSQSSCQSHHHQVVGKCERSGMRELTASDHFLKMRSTKCARDWSGSSISHKIVQKRTDFSLHCLKMRGSTMRSTKCTRDCIESSFHLSTTSSSSSWSDRNRQKLTGSDHFFKMRSTNHSCQFIRFYSFMSIHVNSFIWIHSFHSYSSIHLFQFLHFKSVKSLNSIHSCQLNRFNSFMSIHAFLFMRFNSFMSIPSWQFIRFNSCVWIPSFQIIQMSTASCQFIHVMHFISFRFTSFQLTMNSYKPCLFFETSAPARAGHYLVLFTEQISYTKPNMFIIICMYMYSIYIYIYAN